MFFYKYKFFNIITIILLISFKRVTIYELEQEEIGRESN